MNLFGTECINAMFMHVDCKMLSYEVLYEVYVLCEVATFDMSISRLQLIHQSC